ncbi:MAG TPA: SLC13 family permease [Alphaproteobacteria bacterium]|nr:SLC13 family permease [Alphaproteobacteria bacterium]
MTVALDPGFQMWVALGLVLVALVLYAWERTPIEITSLIILCALLVFFQLFPVRDAAGHNHLDAVRLLEGFGNPALLTVLGLIVVGEGIVQTGLLDRTAQLVLRAGGGRPMLTIAAAMLVALLLSSLLNNVPVVVIFIPIMQALARRLGKTPSHVMIPLGYAVVIGGKLTLIGSSTNLLVSGTLVQIGQRPLGFFEFTVPGLVLAGIGFLYSILVVPRLLPDRKELVGAFIGGSGGGKQFIAQITITPDSKLVGQRATAGFFADLPDMTVRMVLRGEHGFVPPFLDDLVIRPGDLLVVAATRNALVEATKLAPGLLETELQAGGDVEAREGRRSGEQMLVEVMVTPGSSMIGWNVEEIGFRSQYHCIVLGIQRRSRMILSRMTEIRLEAGDVLLIQGRREDVEALRAHRDVLLMEWSAMQLPAVRLRWRAGLIFFAVVASISTDAVPTVTAALIGALAMILARALSLSQAVRAIDSAVIMTIAAALGLGVALEETGGARYVSALLSNALRDLDPALTLSIFFLIVAVISNLINNKACAVIFTPIAVSLAHQLGQDPIVFAIAVVFATNSALASPVAHPATLLVMGPGHYRFRDFIIAGTPMVILNWVVFSLFVPQYYGLT